METTHEVLAEDSSGISSMKIIQLSKKNRELIYSLNSEKAKGILLTKKLRDMEEELRVMRETLKECQSTKEIIRYSVNSNTLKNGDVHEQPHSKYEQQIIELRSQNEVLKHDLKLAKKALELETGEVISNLNQWLTNANINPESGIQNGVKRSGGWRARQQKILALQNRVQMLESILKNNYDRSGKSILRRIDVQSSDHNFTGASSIGVDLLVASEPTFDLGGESKQSEFSLKTALSSQASNKVDCLQKDKERLENDLQETKKKLSACKLRLNNASIELKGLKSKVYMMAQKGYNDDKLVDSLIKYNEALRDTLVELKQKMEQTEYTVQQKEDDYISLDLQSKSELENLKQIISERDEKINELTQQISDLNDAIQTMQKAADQEAENNDQVQTTNLPNTNEQGDVKCLKTELESLKKLVQCLDDRFEQTVEQKLMYEKECYRLKQLLQSLENQPEQTTKPRKPNTQSNQSRKSVQTPTSKLENNEPPIPPNLDRLLSDQFVDETLNKAGLGASAAKIVSKRIRELQSTISNLNNQIEMLQAKTDVFHQARRQDIAFLNQIVNGIRSQSVKDS